MHNNSTPSSLETLLSNLDTATLTNQKTLEQFVEQQLKPHSSLDIQNAINIQIESNLETIRPNFNFYRIKILLNNIIEDASHLKISELSHLGINSNSQFSQWKFYLNRIQPIIKYLKTEPLLKESSLQKDLNNNEKTVLEILENLEALVQQLNNYLEFLLKENSDILSFNLLIKPSWEFMIATNCKEMLGKLRIDKENENKEEDNNILEFYKKIQLFSDMVFQLNADPTRVAKIQPTLNHFTLINVFSESQAKKKPKIRTHNNLGTMQKLYQPKFKFDHWNIQNCYLLNSSGFYISWINSRINTIIFGPGFLNTPENIEKIVNDAASIKDFYSIAPSIKSSFPNQYFQSKQTVFYLKNKLNSHHSLTNNSDNPQEIFSLEQEKILSKIKEVISNDKFEEIKNLFLNQLTIEKFNFISEILKNEINESGNKIKDLKEKRVIEKLKTIFKFPDVIWDRYTLEYYSENTKNAFSQLYNIVNELIKELPIKEPSNNVTEKLFEISARLDELIAEYNKSTSLTTIEKFKEVREEVKKEFTKFIQNEESYNALERIYRENYNNLKDDYMNKIQKLETFTQIIQQINKTKKANEKFRPTLQNLNLPKNLEDDQEQINCPFIFDDWNVVDCSFLSGNYINASWKEAYLWNVRIGSTFQCIEIDKLLECAEESFITFEEANVDGFQSQVTLALLRKEQAKLEIHSEKLDSYASSDTPPIPEVPTLHLLPEPQISISTTTTTSSAIEPSTPQTNFPANIEQTSSQAPNENLSPNTMPIKSSSEVVNSTLPAIPEKALPPQEISEPVIQNKKDVLLVRFDEKLIKEIKEHLKVLESRMTWGFFNGRLKAKQDALNSLLTEFTKFSQGQAHNLSVNFFQNFKNIPQVYAGLTSHTQFLIERAKARWEYPSFVEKMKEAQNKFNALPNKKNSLNEIKQLKVDFINAIKNILPELRNTEEIFELIKNSDNTNLPHLLDYQRGTPNWFSGGETSSRSQVRELIGQEKVSEFMASYSLGH